MVWIAAGYYCLCMVTQVKLILITEICLCLLRLGKQWLLFSLSSMSERFADKAWLFICEEETRIDSVFSGVRVTRSSVLYVCFADRCFSFCFFSFGHCVGCPSIYGLWLPFWYLQTLFTGKIYQVLTIGE
jgi:hypothetical protein